MKTQRALCMFLFLFQQILSWSVTSMFRINEAFAVLWNLLSATSCVLLVLRPIPPTASKPCLFSLPPRSLEPDLLNSGLPVPRCCTVKWPAFQNSYKPYNRHIGSVGWKKMLRNPLVKEQLLQWNIEMSYMCSWAFISQNVEEKIVGL